MNLHKLKEEHMEQSEELKLMATRVSREAQGRKAKVGRLPGSALRPWPGFSQRFLLTPLSFDFVRASGSVAAHATVGLEMATRTGRQDTQHDCYLWTKRTVLDRLNQVCGSLSRC
jgi:hypothetical protein